MFAAIIMLSACERNADPVDPMLNLFTEVPGGCYAHYRFEISDKIETRSIVKGNSIIWEEGDMIHFQLRVISIAWSELQALAQNRGGFIGGVIPCTDYGTVEGKFVYENGSWATYLYSGDINIRERAAGVAQDDSSFSKTEEVTLVSPDDGGYCAVEAQFIYSYGELTDRNHYQIDAGMMLPFTEGTQTIVVHLPLKKR